MTLSVLPVAAHAGGTYHNGMLAQAVQPLVDDHTIAGAVLFVAGKNGILAEETVGKANIEKQTPMSRDNMFWVASETKTFTTVALMMLVDQGKINIADPVSKYLPEFASLQVAQKQADGTTSALRAPVRPLLVENLLNHTSSLNNDQPFRKHPGYALKDYVADLAKLPLTGDPDTKFWYSNANFEVLGRIVEAVSGVPYADFISRNIIQPLGLTNTTFWPDAAQRARLATAYAYTHEPPGYKAVDEWVPVDLPKDQLTADPAGGLFSNAEDISRYARMLLRGGELDGHRYIAAADVRLIGSTHTGDVNPQEHGYGYGMMTMSMDHGRDKLVAPGMFGHEGAWSTDFEIDPQDGLVFVTMMQQTRYAKGKSRNTVYRPFWNAAIAAFGHSVANR